MTVRGTLSRHNGMLAPGRGSAERTAPFPVAVCPQSASVHTTSISMVSVNVWCCGNMRCCDSHKLCRRMNVLESVTFTLNVTITDVQALPAIFFSGDSGLHDALARLLSAGAVVPHTIPKLILHCLCAGSHVPALVLHSRSQIATCMTLGHVGPCGFGFLSSLVLQCDDSVSHTGPIDAGHGEEPTFLPDNILGLRLGFSALSMVSVMRPDS